MILQIFTNCLLHLAVKVRTGASHQSGWCSLASLWEEPWPHGRHCRQGFGRTFSIDLSQLDKFVESLALLVVDIGDCASRFASNYAFVQRKFSSKSFKLRANVQGIPGAVLSSSCSSCHEALLGAKLWVVYFFSGKVASGVAVSAGVGSIWESCWQKVHRTVARVGLAFQTV